MLARRWVLPRWQQWPMLKSQNLEQKPFWEILNSQRVVTFTIESARSVHNSSFGKGYTFVLMTPVFCILTWCTALTALTSLRSSRVSVLTARRLAANWHRPVPGPGPGRVTRLTLTSGIIISGDQPWPDTGAYTIHKYRSEQGQISISRVFIANI